MNELIHNQQNEIAVLSHALELHAQQEGVQGSLLYEVSKLNRDNVMLSEDNSNKSQFIESMQNELFFLKQTVEELQSSKELILQEYEQKTQDVRTLC